MGKLDEGSWRLLFATLGGRNDLLDFWAKGMIDSSGCVDNPVVDVWYDLEMLEDVPDVSLFLKECLRIRQ